MRISRIWMDITGKWHGGLILSMMKKVCCNFNRSRKFSVIVQGSYKTIAGKRDKYMREFLKEFQDEWNKLSEGCYI